MEKTLHDKIGGCLMGCAVGDALGVPHEFRFHKKNVYTGLLYIVPEYHFQYSHRIDVVGQYSDDTQMTLCNIRSIIEKNGVYDRNAVILKYEKWAATAKEMGVNTRALFKGVKTIKGYEKRYKKIFTDKAEDEWTQSNGSLMRCSILSFFGEDVVIKDCELTNPHPINIDSSRLYTFLIVCSATNKTKKFILAGIKNLDLREEVMNVFTDATSSKVPKRDVSGKSKGWVLHALYCACWAWKYAKNYQDAIDTIIKLGGDTDTNAAITGALLGAKFGLRSMKEEERTAKNIDIMLNADTTKGQNPIQEWLRLDDFDTIIDNLTVYIDPLFS